MANGDTKALQGQIDSLKAELALRSELAEKLFNSKNESMDKRLSGHIKFFNVIFISLAGVIGLITIVSAFYGKYAIKNWIKDIVSVKVQTLVDDSKKDLDERIVNIEKNIQFNFWYSKGLLAFNNKEYSGSLTFFIKAVENNPENPYVYNARGAAYGRKGEREKAIKDFKKSIDLLPTNPLPYINIARIYVSQGKKVEAKEEINKVKKMIEDGKVKEEEIAFFKEEVKDVQKLLE